MKSINKTNLLKSNMFSQELRSGVFAKASARKSYQRLFEIAKLNFQSVENPTHIANLLYQG